MKKLISIVLLLALAIFTFAACAEEPDDTQIRVGYITGPTGMGMAKLIHDNGGTEGNEKYSFTRYENPNLATADLAAGKIDVICMPTNDAATYYNANGSITVLAVNTLSSLFLVTDKNTTVTSFAELDGKTVYTCKSGTPKVITQFLIDSAGINATVSDSYNGNVIAAPKDLGALLTEGSIEIAIVPEPILTSSLLTIKQSGDTSIEYSIDLKISDVWNSYCATPLTMGCIVADEGFAKAHKTVINAFLDEYEKSIEYVNASENIDATAEFIAEAKIMGAAAPAKIALGHLHDAIAYIDGAEMKSALKGFYSSINIQEPSDEFYYKK